MGGFELVELEHGPGCREIQVVGELDLAVAGRLKEVLDRTMASGCERLLVSLERCEFIDSTGIATIVQAHGRMAELGGRLMLYGPTDQVARVLSITGLNGNGLVFDSAEEALAAPGSD